MSSLNWSILFISFTSFILTFLIIPILIRVAIKLNWVDNPSERKVHTNAIPTLGGVGIVAGLLLSFSPYIFQFHLQKSLGLFLVIVILMAIGIYDDLHEISAKKKLVMQLLLGAIICFLGYRIESFYGIFGIYEIPLILQYGITIIFISGFINAFNFIDGIDGLAGGIALMNSVVLALFFLYAGDDFFSLWALGLAGACAAFLCYNINPARIFMGDTGSTVIGLLLALMGIKLVQIGPIEHLPHLNNIVIAIIGILILPIYDIFRTISFRIMRKQSPFQPDKTHIHHLLLKTRFNHIKSASILYISNFLLIVIAFSIKNYVSLFEAIVILLVSCFLLTELLSIKKILNLKLDFSSLKRTESSLIKTNQFLNRNIENISIQALDQDIS